LHNVAENQLEPDFVLGDIGEATRWGWSDWFGPARTIFGRALAFAKSTSSAKQQILGQRTCDRTWPTLHRTVVCGTSLVFCAAPHGLPRAH